MKANKNQSGFTLVELAIVMIIIGLLIGGVLKGQKLIENAKVTATISELKSFQTAMLSFKDTYGSLPGDIATADQRLPGCAVGNAIFCLSGNGDALIGIPPTDIMTFNAGVGENFQFWKHLAVANMITGINPSADPANPAWGDGLPASSLRGGYHIFFNNDRWQNGEYGHNIRLQNPIGAPTVNAEGLQSASPNQAYQIDRKIDDGIPTSGVIAADDSRGGASDCEGDSYGLVSGELTNRKDCVILYLMD